MLGETLSSPDILNCYLCLHNKAMHNSVWGQSKLLDLPGRNNKVAETLERKQECWHVCPYATIAIVHFIFLCDIFQYSETCVCGILVHLPQDCATCRTCGHLPLNLWYNAVVDVPNSTQVSVYHRNTRGKCHNSTKSTRESYLKTLWVPGTCYLV